MPMTDEQKAEFNRKMAEAKARKKAAPKPAAETTTHVPSKKKPKPDKPSKVSERREHERRDDADDDDGWLL